MNDLETLMTLAETQLKLEKEFKDLETALEKKKHELKNVSMKRIPELMEALGLQDFTLTDGRKLTLKKIIITSIPKDTEYDAFKWLRNHRYASLIKNKFEVEFSAKNTKEATRFRGQLNRRKVSLNVKEKMTVHASTLKSFVKTALEEGINLPDSIYIDANYEAIIK